MREVESKINTMKPSFVIIGGVKCASSSLYRYLNDHPLILPCKTKEPRYFNNRFWIQLLLKYPWYLNQFHKKGEAEAVGDWLDLGEDDKMHASQFRKRIEPDKNYITGEATASTFMNVNPKRIKFIFPKMKLILLLREPAERFISHYNMFVRLYNEGKARHKMSDLDSFIEKEITDFNAGKKTMILRQGNYMEKLPKWKSVFGENLKVFKSTDLKGEIANETMNEICDFLKIPNHNFTSILKVKYNSAGNSSKNSDALERLKDFYKPQLAALEQDFGITFK